MARLSLMIDDGLNKAFRDMVAIHYGYKKGSVKQRTPQQAAGYSLKIKAALEDAMALYIHMSDEAELRDVAREYLMEIIVGPK